MLVTLYFVRASQGIAPDVLAQEVVAAVRSSSDPRYEPHPKDWAIATKSLETLLSNDSGVGLAVRAAFLAHQTARHMDYARILTDARPVFGSDANSGPIAFVLTHTLQIDYHEEGTVKEWFIALDHDDLEALADAVNRAKIKEKTLRTSLRKTQIPIVSDQGMRSSDED